MNLLRFTAVVVQVFVPHQTERLAFAFVIALASFLLSSSVKPYKHSSDRSFDWAAKLALVLILYCNDECAVLGIVHELGRWQVAFCCSNSTLATWFMAARMLLCWPQRF